MISPRYSCWCRFSLRTLLAVPMILGAWLAWEGVNVRRRDAALRKIEHAGGYYVFADASQSLRLGLRLFGARPLHAISRPRGMSSEEMQSVRKLFPEIPSRPRCGGVICVSKIVETFDGATVEELSAYSDADADAEDLSRLRVLMLMLRH